MNTQVTTTRPNNHTNPSDDSTDNPEPRSSISGGRMFYNYCQRSLGALTKIFQSSQNNEANDAVPHEPINEADEAQDDERKFEDSSNQGFEDNFPRSNRSNKLVVEQYQLKYLSDDLRTQELALFVLNLEYELNKHPEG